MKNLMDKFYGFSEMIFFSLKLNLAVIAGTITGLFFLGIGPALQAGHHMAKLEHQKRSLPFFKTYVGYYRDNFISANRIYLPLILLCGIPSYVVGECMIPYLTTPFIVMLAISQIIICGAVITALPLVEFYEIKPSRTVTTALKFMTHSPISCILSLIVSGLCLMAVYVIPALTIVIIGLWSYLNMGLYLRFFEENEKRVASRNEESTTNPDVLEAVIKTPTLENK